MRRLPILALLAAATLLAGCKGTQMPRLFGAPPAWFQRKQAEVFDPYPLDDAGPSNHGGNVASDIRPRDFTAPSAEGKRAQQSPYAPYQRFKGE